MTPEQDAGIERMAKSMARAMTDPDYEDPTAADHPLASQQANVEARPPKELRRLAVEAMLDAHYDVGCDAARELAWYEAHPQQAAALVAALAPPGASRDPKERRQAVARALFAARVAGFENEVEGWLYRDAGNFREAYAGVDTFLEALAEFGFDVRATETECVACAEPSHEVDYHDHHRHPGADTTYIGEAHS